jgi:hypothetical protein
MAAGQLLAFISGEVEARALSRPLFCTELSMPENGSQPWFVEH